MSNYADSFALSPFMLGEAFFAGAVAMQRQTAANMMAVFDAIADTMNDSLRASAELAHEIGSAQSPADVVAAGMAWFQGRVEKGMSWLRTLSSVGMPVASAVAPLHQAEPATVPSVPAAISRAPIVPQADARMSAKPPAGRLQRPAPIVIPKMPKKPARPGAK